MNRSDYHPCHQQGFTLIEIMVAVMIVGILTALALPMYGDNVIRANRAEARAELMVLVSNMERYYSFNNSYVESADPLDNIAKGSGGGLGNPEGGGGGNGNGNGKGGGGGNSGGDTLETINGHYVLSVEAGPAGIADSYVAIATAQGEQADKDSCQTLTITHTGARGATGDTVEECWQR